MVRSLTVRGSLSLPPCYKGPVEATGQTEEQLREQAVERLKKKRDFKTHLFMYAVINAFLIAIWAITSDANGFFWPAFVLAGWGIGLVGNAWDVYGRKPISEDEIRREADRLRGTPGA
jgi:hypothetical protein